MRSDLVRVHHAEYAEDIPFWLKVTEGLDPILEIGCGHGRVTLPLLEAGRDVVGVDRDSDSLAYLRGMLEGYDKELRQRISLINEDILGFRFHEPIGAAIIPCNTYSTFNPGDRRRLLEIVFSGLRSGGSFIASLPNPRQTDEIFSELKQSDQIEGPDLERLITHPGTGYPVQVSSRLRAARESLVWDWIYDHLHPDGQVERIVVTAEHFPASQEAILTELNKAGFTDVLCQGDFSGGQYSDSSPYLILICRK